MIRSARAYHCRSDSSMNPRENRKKKVAKAAKKGYDPIFNTIVRKNPLSSLIYQRGQRVSVFS